MEHLISSSIGSACAEILTLPICTVKTIYQTQTSLRPKQICINLYKSQGIKGFFQASGPAIASQVLSTSSKYFLYHKIKEFRQTDSSDILSNSINGALGGIGGSLLSHPFDVWKNHVQRSVILPDLSIKTLYSGYSGSIVKNLVLYSLLFPVYDFYKLHLPNPIFASIATTLTCSLATQPVDYYKTVKMSSQSFITILEKQPNGNKFFSWTNPYKGFGLMISRSIPHFIISMGITDWVKTKL